MKKMNKHETRRKGNRSGILLPAILCGVLLVPAHAFAGMAKPDFSGTWKLNEDKTEMGEGRFGPAPNLVVKQDGKKFEVTRTRMGRNGQERSFTSGFTLDGKEVKEEGENRSSKSTATWSEDGKTLMIRTESKFSRNGQTFERTSNETWKLSDGGKTLTIDSTSKSQRGERKFTAVYDKQ